MKLMISGKGGSGKSTVAALLAKNYAKDKKRVVVVDADVSTVLGPHRLLGTDIPDDLIGYFNGENVVREKLKALRHAGRPENVPNLGTWTYDTIPAGYGSVKNGIQLVTIGKLRDTTVSCKSPWMGLARQFILGMQLTENERLIVDTEAGIEHFGRGIDSVCDANLMVVDPTYESSQLAERAAEMAGNVKIPLYFVLNKTNENTSRTIRHVITDKSRIIGEIPQDPVLLGAGLGGRALPENYPLTGAVIKTLEEKVRGPT
ncbi:P-loop NTPase [Methanoregula sp. UBA64]|jgi:CO dehydrogenase maturation factor|uniref:nucleotide-binding protein n=1 Tax=Methanoregula sp. UBA64 TaxID=1915554 RepID=UPI0025EB30BB|nr:P-loop NTPase [Methanoregula sp. UBA64]